MPPTDSGFPMNDPLAAWLDVVTGPLPGTGARVMDRPNRFFSSVDMVAGTAAGTTLQQKFNFFTEAREDFVSNLDTPNQIPPNSGFALEGVGINFTYGSDRLGRRLGQTSPTAAQKLLSSLTSSEFTVAAAAAALINPAMQAVDLIRYMFSVAQATFTIKNQEIFTIRDLGSFPSGKGLALMGGNSLTSNSATVGASNNSTLNFSNGIPTIHNMFRFQRPYPMPGGQTFQFSINLPQTIQFADTDIGPLASETATVGLVAGHWTVELIGRYGTPQ